MSLTHSSDRSAPWENRSHIRRLRRSDRADFAAHLLRLDAESRRMRFGSAVGDAVLARYAEGALGDDSVLKGVFMDGTLRGAAELRAIRSPLPEAAFSLEQPWQGQGHGARLFASLVDTARNSGLRRFTLQCLSGNVAMQKIARRHQAQLHFEDGEVTAELRHPGGDMASLTREAAEERFAQSLAAADRALYRLATEVGVDLRLRRV
ncbi:GNAT family N-acetyltransferase [Aureimonas sp. AU40]|uniref:GNAT family N-acetyltransferase n=1 Tax=Aureimonas sp. AU40 TaxID=1637747 RepID=UPI0007825001|nr:GNAT family N-acetyltransferase [Aureimonas sp. AU40]